MQWVTHWVVGDVPLTLRQQYNLPSDAKGIDGVYESCLGTHVAYQVKYRQNGYLTYTEVAPFLGITERFTGLGRDYPHPDHAHLYHGDFSDPGLPMCRYGWNREGGES